MEIALLTALLAPCLPFLLLVGEKASEKAAEKVGECTWNKAKAVWTKLHPKIAAKEAAKEAVIDVANNPEDEDLQAALRVQLKKLLDQDQELATAIARILQEDSLDDILGNQTTRSITKQSQVIGQMFDSKAFNVQGGLMINE